MASIFAKIIQGAIPSYKIYENENIYAFLDIRPVNLGHTLIVPKLEVDHILDVQEPHYSATFAAVKLLGKAIQKATACKRVGLLVQGFEVPHFHVHVVPMWSPRDIDLSYGQERPSDEMVAIRDRIVAHLIE